MNFSFQSWESLFVFHLIWVLIFPWISTRLRILTFLAYPLLGLFEHLALGRGDLEFFMKLYFLDMSPTFLALQILAEKRSRKSFWSICLFSLLASISALIYSRSLWLLDPFWGAIPGTISIDPIISLKPYFLKLLLTLIFWTMMISSRRPSVALMAYFAASGMIGLSSSSSLTSSEALKTHFFERGHHKNISVWLETAQTSSWRAQAWARELSFLYEEILERLPENHLAPEPIEVFIYDSDDSKFSWIGARRTQIGNFLHSELHLSQISPFSEVLPHELAHIVHAHLRAPLISYLDPYYLEGFAVALSETDPERLLDRGRALYEKWKHYAPRWLSFFSEYSPRISYTWAGAEAFGRLQSGRFPWELAHDFKIYEIEPSSDSKAWVERAAATKPFFKDPFFRDCARLEWMHSKDPTSSSEEKLSKLCPQWKTQPAYQAPLDEQELLKAFWKEHEDEKNLSQLQDFYLALSKNDLIRARSIVEALRPDSTLSPGFRKRLEWELRQ